MTRFFSELGQDIRYGCRTMAANKAFSAMAILSLALGIGANTAIFSLINATLFSRQPVADPDRLVDIYQNGVNRNVEGRTVLRVLGYNGNGAHFRRTTDEVAKGDYQEFAFC